MPFAGELEVIRGSSDHTFSLWAAWGSVGSVVSSSEKMRSLLYEDANLTHVR